MRTRLMGGPNMQGTQKVFGGIVLATMALGLVLIPQGASSQSTGTSSQEPNTELVPAFHTSVPAGPLPETMSPALFTEPIAQNAYRIAARIKKILFQQPCYCHCDRSQGHGSLLD